MRWASRYPARFVVESRSVMNFHLQAVAAAAMPHWDEDNPVTLRQYLVMVGDEFELLCQREKFNATLIAQVALGIVPQDELGYTEMVRFSDAVEAVRVRRAEVEADEKNARIVYERMYGDKADAGNITEFPKRRPD